MKDITMTLEHIQEIKRKEKEERLLDSKVLKDIKNNTELGKRNRDKFKEGERKFETCALYNPCPICDKCQNKASHLYVRCQTCTIPICVHKYSDRAYLIRRDNFKLNVSDEAKVELERMASKYENKL